MTTKKTKISSPVVPVGASVPVVSPVASVPVASVDASVPVASPVASVDASVPVASVASVPVMPALPSLVLGLLNAPKTKANQPAPAPKVEKIKLQSMEEQNFDYLAYALSCWGVPVSFKDNNTRCSLERDFIDLFASSIAQNGLGSIDSEDNFSGRVLHVPVAPVGTVAPVAPVVSLTDYQVYAFSKGYTQSKHHEGVYTWQAQKFLKAVLIAQAVKVGNVSLVIDSPVSCGYISLSWASFAKCLLALGASKMNEDRKTVLAKHLGDETIAYLDAKGLLLQLEVGALFASVLKFGLPVASPVASSPVASPVASK